MKQMQTIDQRQLHRFEILFFLMISVLLYGRTVGFGFVWDDRLLIIDNPYFQQKLSIPDVFKHGMWSFASSEDKIPFYRPLLTLTYWLEMKIWGPNPFFYHVVNLFLHLSSVCLLWILALKFQLSDWGRRFACALFCVHPAIVPTVSFISCHGDLMVQFLGLLSVMVWLRRDGIRYLAIIFIFVAMLIKESAIIFPFILVAYDIWFGKKPWKNIKVWSPFFAYAIYFPLRFLALQDNDPTPLNWNFILTGQGVYRTFAYIGRLIFPIPSSLQPRISEFPLWGNLCLFIVFTLSVFYFFKRNKENSEPKWFGFWFLLSLLLISDWTGRQIRFSDQLLYGSMVPISFLIGSITIQSRRNVIFWNVLLSLFAAISITQIPIWKSDYSFWTNEIQYHPDDPNTAMSYISEYIATQNPENPCELYQQVGGLLEKNYSRGADYFLNYYLGNCYLETNPTLAETYFRKAIKISNAQWQVKNNLAASLIKQGKYEEVLPYVQQMTAEAPRLFVPWRNLGAVYAKLNRYTEALQALEKARAIDPENQEIDKMIQAVLDLQTNAKTRKNDRK